MSDTSTTDIKIAEENLVQGLAAAAVALVSGECFFLHLVMGQMGTAQLPAVVGNPVRLACLDFFWPYVGFLVACKSSLWDRRWPKPWIIPPSSFILLSSPNPEGTYQQKKCNLNLYTGFDIPQSTHMGSLETWGTPNLGDNWGIVWAGYLGGQPSSCGVLRHLGCAKPVGTSDKPISPLEVSMSVVGLEDHSHNRVALSTSSSFLNLCEHLHAQDSPLNIWRNATVTVLLAFISPGGERACMQTFLYKLKKVCLRVCVYMHTCVHTHHVHTQGCPWRLEESVRCLGTELEAVVNHPAWDINSDPWDWEVSALSRWDICPALKHFSIK